MIIPEFDDDEVQNFFNNYYVDRGMIKWQGFYLSDHTSALNKEKRLNQKVLDQNVKPEMDFNEVSKIINKAIIKKERVEITPNKRDFDGIYAQAISGFITGYQNDEICIAEETFIKIIDIRNIKIIFD